MNTILISIIIIWTFIFVCCISIKSTTRPKTLNFILLLSMLIVASGLVGLIINGIK